MEKQTGINPPLSLLGNKMTNNSTLEHTLKRTVEEIEVIPGHTKRMESKEFLKSKKQLTLDGYGKCYICGSTQNIQAHHYGIEWALWNDCDP